MTPVLVYCDGCGERIRVSWAGQPRSGRCPVCALPLDPAALERAELLYASRRARLIAYVRAAKVAALASTSAALVVGSLVLGLTVAATLTPRLTGRLEADADQTSAAAPTGESPGGDAAVSQGVSSLVPARSYELSDVSIPPVTRVESELPADLQPPEAPELALRSDASAPFDALDAPPLPPADDVRKPSAGEDASPPPTATAPTAAPKTPEPKHIRVRTAAGRTVIARLHGRVGSELHVMLPDGQLGIADRLSVSDEPFIPATAHQVVADLQAGPFKDFPVYRTAHYVVVSDGTESFARESGRILENLYKGLTDAFRKRGIPVRESEFPLVAVIFKSEREFRAHRRVDDNVQAFYEIYTNRIFFYENSARDELTPEVAALRQPQTVAHEGTHQILQNIGLHPRLAPWPPWLIEGFAEYCATPVSKKTGTTWSGLGVVNTQHLVTIRDLADPDSAQVPGAARAEHIGRPRGMPLVEYLVTKTNLSPTDYALSWALTHYLAMKRTDEFVAYLKAMSELPPFEKRTSADHLQAFRDAFGGRLDRLDKEINAYLGKLKVKDQLPFYAVTFHQRIPDGLTNRSAMVSQSPSLIRQWLDTVTTLRGDPPAWEAVPFPSRTRAWLAAEQWVKGS